MSETNVLDMLNESVGADALEPTLFPEGATVVFDVTKAELDTTMDESTGEAKAQVVISLATCNEEKTTKGSNFPRGYPFTYYLSLKTKSRKGKDIADLVRQRVAEWIKATGGTLPAPLGDPANYVGKRVTAVMSIDAGDGTFRKQNRIQKFINPA